MKEADWKEQVEDDFIFYKKTKKYTHAYRNPEYHIKTSKRLFLLVIILSLFFCIFEAQLFLKQTTNKGMVVNRDSQQMPGDRQPRSETPKRSSQDPQWISLQVEHFSFAMYLTVSSVFDVLCAITSNGTLNINWSDSKTMLATLVLNCYKMQLFCSYVLYKTYQKSSAPTSK